MDYQAVMSDYQELSDVSDKDSEIMSSALLDQKLREKNLGSLEDNITGLVRVRLAIPLFRDLFQQMQERGDADSRGAALQILQCYIVKSLEVYSAEEQKAILLEMHAQMLDLCRETTQAPSFDLGGAQREPLKRYSVEELSEKLAKKILNYSEEVFESQEMASKVVVSDELNRDTYSPGAAAAAIYLNDSVLRSCPEAIGVMVGISDGITDTIQYESEDSLAGVIATALLAMSVLMLFLFLLEVAVFSALEMSTFLGAGKAFTWMTVKAAISEAVNITGPFMLMIAAGLAAGGMVAGTTAYILDGQSINSSASHVLDAAEEEGSLEEEEDEFEEEEPADY